MKSFRDRVAAVSGAASGIGRALALALAGEGCHLSLADLDEAGLGATCDAARRADVSVTSASVDVSRLEDVRAWAAATVRDHGRVNLVVNNAGVALGSTIDAMSYDDLRWVMGVNFWGVVHGTKEFLPHLERSGQGHIVNVSSIFGLGSQPTQGAYNASKFAVRGFTEALRQELDLKRSGVSATCVLPGGIRTNIARAARVTDSLRSVGLDPGHSHARFERFLRGSPEAAATAILDGVRRDARRVLIGADAHLFDALARLLPAGYQRLVTFGMRRMLR